MSEKVYKIHTFLRELSELIFYDFELRAFKVTNI